ncbi:MAG TPA: alpha/beta hydrolase [Smithellaceae bacterium]|nr:alpha/beta hydrolase [Smithellaceae bacterium]
MNVKKIKLLILLLPVFFTGCEAVVNHYGFAPAATDPAVRENLPASVQELYLTTDDQEKLQCFFVASKASGKVVVYFHGNAGNLYQRLPELASLAQAGVSVLGVGYRGYGKSTGKPSEKGIIRDGAAALRHVTEKMGYRPEQVFLYGRSIGTVVAISIAGEKKLAGLILITPLTSGRDMMKAHGLGLFAFIAGDSLNNLARCGEISSPVLIIHGTEDEVTPLRMGEQIFAALSSPKEMVTIKGGNHNELEWQDPSLYWNSIAKFINSRGNAR